MGWLDLNVAVLDRLRSPKPLVGSNLGSTIVQGKPEKMSIHPSVNSQRFR